MRDVLGPLDSRERNYQKKCRLWSITGRFVSSIILYENQHRQLRFCAKALESRIFVFRRKSSCERRATNQKKKLHRLRRFTEGKRLAV